MTPKTFFPTWLGLLKPCNLIHSFTNLIVTFFFFVSAQDLVGANSIDPFSFKKVYLRDTAITEVLLSSNHNLLLGLQSMLPLGAIGLESLLICILAFVIGLRSKCVFKKDGLSNIESSNNYNKVANPDSYLSLISELHRKVDGLTNQLNEEERLRKELELQLYTKSVKLDATNNEIDQFAYIVSHDLKEPIRMVSIYSQLLEQKYGDQLDDNAKDYLGFAREGATRATKLLDDLMNYTLLQATEVKEEVNLNHVSEEVIENLSDMIEENQAEIKIEPLPIIVACKTHLVHLLQNLIANSIKFRNGDSPVINVSTKDLGYHYLFAVKDNGIGIKMEYKDKIFKIFQRLHSREKYEGNGVGLAFCKKIVERCGGTIWFDSKPNQETTFYFTIPKIALTSNSSDLVNNVLPMHEKVESQITSELKVV